MPHKEYMNDVWYVAINDLQSRPVTFQELCKLARIGKIGATHKIRTANSKWMEASSLAGLIPEESGAESSTSTMVFDHTNQKVCSRSSQGTSQKVGSFWSCRIQGQEYGPFQFDTLVQMVNQGELSGADQVRDEDGSWRSVRQIPDLKILLNQSNNNTSASIPQQDITSLKAAEAWKESKQRSATNARRAQANPQPVTEPSLFDDLSTWWENANIKVVSCIILVLGLVWFGYRQFYSVPTKQYYDCLIEAKEEFQTLRQAQASQQEWDAYQLKFKQETASMLQTLEKRASNDRPELQHLLAASRDAMPQMLQDARENISESELYFNREMELVRQLIEMQ